MIRLVTQFDDADARVSLATPTCGGCCCCCCCCVATAVGSSAYTAMNLRAHARRLEETTGRSLSPWPEIVGVIALPIVLVVAAVASGGLDTYAVLLIPAAWFLILFGLYSLLASRNAWLYALGTVVVTVAAAALELVAGAFLVLSGAAGLLVYALAVAAAIFASIAYFRRRLLGKT